MTRSIAVAVALLSLLWAAACIVAVVGWSFGVEALAGRVGKKCLSRRKPTMPRLNLSVWTEGVCADGAAILCDGAMVPISVVLVALNHREALRVAWSRLPLGVVYNLPTHSQCAAKVEAGVASEIERFIDANEPAGPSDADWRASFAAALSEAVEEDRAASMPEFVPA